LFQDVISKIADQELRHHYNHSRRRQSQTALIGRGKGDNELKNQWTITEEGELGKGVKFTITTPKLNKNGKENYRIVP
jgi:hypothetical protein